MFFIIMLTFIIFIGRLTGAFRSLVKSHLIPNEFMYVFYN
jgi:hypothetical protein